MHRAARLMKVAMLRKLLASFALIALFAVPAHGQILAPVLPQFGVTAPGVTPRQFCAKTIDGKCWPFMTQDPSTGAFSLLFQTALSGPDLTFAGNQQADFIGLAQGGMISYCPLLSCVYTPTGSNTPTPSFYDHQRGSAVFSHITNDDAHSEEQTVGVETQVTSGRTLPYGASTAYNIGDNIQIGNATYRACSTSTPCAAGYTSTPAGTTGAASPPPGTRPTASQTGNYTVQDGSVWWRWINDAAIGAKVGIYDELSARGPNAGPWWGMAINTEFGAGSIPFFGTPLEIDFSNNSGQDCALGSCQGYGIFMLLGGNNINTAGLYMGGNGPNYNEYFGIILAGQKLASFADFEDNGGATIGYALCSYAAPAGGCAHSAASIKDQATSPVGLFLAGAYSSAAIDTSLSTGTGNQINGKGFTVNATGLGTFTGLIANQNGGQALTLNNISSLNSALTIVDAATGGQTWQMGPGSCSGSTDFILCDITAGNQRVLDIAANGAATFFSGGTSVGQITGTGLNGMAIGATTKAAGAFTTLTAAALPTAGGTVKGTVCVDTTGVVYVKTTTGACL